MRPAIETPDIRKASVCLEQHFQMKQGPKNTSNNQEHTDKFMKKKNCSL